MEQGFAVVKDGKTRFSLNDQDVSYAVLVCGDIEVSMCAHEDKLIEVRLQFTLHPTLNDWDVFVHEFCRCCNLLIFD